MIDLLKFNDGANAMGVVGQLGEPAQLDSHFQDTPAVLEMPGERLSVGNPAGIRFSRHESGSILASFESKLSPAQIKAALFLLRIVTR